MKSNVGLGSRFVSPMLAAAMPREISDLAIEPGTWAAEEKYDGHRLCVAVAPDGGDLFGSPSVTAWSRNGLVRVLPPQIREELGRLPSGVYDGELVVPGRRSYGVTVLEDEHLRELRIFDATELVGRDTTSMKYADRRCALAAIFKHHERALAKVSIAESTPVTGIDDVLVIRNRIWKMDGEGLVLKRLDSVYEVGKRSKSWRKIKALRSSVLKIVGFREGRLGAHSVTILRDDEGNETTVKTAGGNSKELAFVEANWRKMVGRPLRIEYQERTPDGGYRHPRWDRWADETDR